jgi:hypothetical protein
MKEIDRALLQALIAGLCGGSIFMNTPATKPTNPLGDMLHGARVREAEEAEKAK